MTTESSPSEWVVWQTASRQLLRAVRGRRSQVAFARRLAYRGNPVADWEAGRRCPTAHELLRACVVCGLDVRGAFERFHAPAAPALGSPQQARVGPWLDSLRGSTPLTMLAARCGHSRFAVARWISGRAKPRVHEWLALVEAITGRASDLVAELVPIGEVPALQAGYEARKQARDLAFEQPWTEAILRLIETHPVGSQLAEPASAVIARALDIEETVAQQALSAMRHADVVRERDGVLVEASPLNVDTRGNPEGFNRLRQHWAREAARRLEAPRAQDWFAYNVLSLSSEELEQARAILRDAYREVRGLAAASQRPEHALLLNMHLLCWSDSDERR